MKLSKENGFEFNGWIRLADKSINALYPEFSLNTDYQKISPTYLKWKKENEETGITQHDFLNKYELGKHDNFSSLCKKEADSLCKKQYEELQRRFDAFDEQFYCKKCKDSSVDFDYENKLNVIKRIVLEVRCLIHKYTRW